MRHATWRERVKDALSTLLQELPPLDDDAWDAADHVAMILGEP
jgi:hypothetical protein